MIETRAVAKRSLLARSAGSMDLVAGSPEAVPLRRLEMGSALDIIGVGGTGEGADEGRTDDNCKLLVERCKRVAKP